MTMTIMKRFLQEESGQDLVEYALLLALVVLAAVSGVGVFGVNILGTWTSLHGAVSGYLGS
ncbi:MAG: hypothetical protein MUF01_05000 [Bryobacterales bacterium]|jgi:Flp pilus assembly pilin Flp|nr:hypothetical protein [Bryobacterales bacterium]